MVLLVDVLVVGIIILLAVVALIFVFLAWVKERRELKKKYRELSAQGKNEMDESPLVG